MALNPQQQKAVDTIHGPVLILAGAGTGKTRTITQRIASLVRDHKVQPDAILALTFTNKAGSEMKERLRSLLGDELARRILAGTFHRFCLTVLRRWPKEAGLRRDFTICDQREQSAHAQIALQQAPQNVRDRFKDAFALVSALSHLKTQSLTTQLPDPGEDPLADVLRAYNRRMRSCNCVDFDDIILLAVRLLQSHEELRQRINQQYQYILVDEYQDTNPPQFQLIQAIAGPGRNVCVVGDDDQSIYGWRGADLRNILDFEQHFPGTTVIRLEQNYRSTQTILEAANAVIANNRNRHPKKLWSALGEGEAIRLITLPDDVAEAQWIAEDLCTRKTLHRRRFEDFAIAYRTNGQSRALEVELRARRVPYQVIGGQEFYDRKEVRDLLAFMKILVNPNDESSLLRIIDQPPRGIGPKRLQHLEQALPDEPSLFARLGKAEKIDSLPTNVQQAAVFFHHTVARAAADLKSHPNSNRFHRFLDDIGYRDHLLRHYKDTDERMQRHSNIQELLSTLDRFHQEHPSGSLADYLEDQALASDQDRVKDQTRDGQGVTLITLHSCKGLEYPHLYLVGAEDGLIPHQRSKEEGTLDEERRLFYVGITRAQRTLCISRCENRRKFGKNLRCLPSPFLAELPPSAIQEISPKDDNEEITMDQARDLFRKLLED
jgi:superfamily I DNA/RNA helicase